MADSIRFSPTLESTLDDLIRSVREQRVEGLMLVGSSSFAEWTPDNHLRHSRFIALRDDKDAKDLHRE